jgi:hypothetical protein
MKGVYIMIEVRAYFSGWHEVDKETAKRFCKHMIKGSIAVPQDKKVQWLEENYLRGITVAELFKS